MVKNQWKLGLLHAHCGKELAITKFSYSQTGIRLRLCCVICAVEMIKEYDYNELVADAAINDYRDDLKSRFPAEFAPALAIARRTN
jgi:hypothetical protein